LFTGGAHDEVRGRLSKQYSKRVIMAETDLAVLPESVSAPGKAPSAAVRALVFPGQGAQCVGMGRELAATFPVAREVFDEVDHALGKHLSRLMVTGPEDELILTENAQPALMAVGIAVLRVLELDYELPLPRLGRFVAGHSLGEYTALTAAGSFSVSDTARLLRARGLAMQHAVPVGEGAMAALMGVDLQTAREVAAEATHDTYDGSVCVAANDNAPGQVVISGTRAAVARALEIAALRGARRGVLLPVSGPFHCPLMAPVADIMQQALEGVLVRAPLVPLISNISASEVTDPAEIRRLLVRQVTSMVRWRESVMYMRSRGIGELVEIGTGRILASLARRIDRRLIGTPVGLPAEVDAFARTFSG
jgi:[acyl-carrier-protein] S-malonyltransferase